MIVKMSKYAFMVYHKEYEPFLKLLREQGVVHVKETSSIADNELLRSLLALRKRVAVISRELSGVRAAAGVPASSKGEVVNDMDKEKGTALLDQIEATYERKSQLNARKQSLEKDMTYMELWGDFSYADAAKLKEAGYEMNFFTCPTSKYEPKWNELYNATLINNFQSVTYFVTITKIGTPIDIEADRPKMPAMDLARLRESHKAVLEEIKTAEDEIQHYAVDQYGQLEAFDRLLENEFNYNNVIAQTAHVADNMLMLLEGWVPTENAQALEEALTRDDYYFQRLEIEEADNVPIKLRNNSFSRLYEPITKMFSLPNYYELDPTPLFAPFFMLFFGLCFGDGGYGLLVIIACALLKKKVDPDFKPYLSLFQYLGLAAVIVGACTGSVFGIALAEVPALAKVKDYFVSSDNLMTFSIVIGLVQIIFGKCVAAYKTKMQKGVKYCIAPFAWVFTIVALAIALGLPAMNLQLPVMVVNVCFGIAAVGLVVAYLYNSPGKNIFLNFGTGLWNTYNMASGLLGDTLSYIRLFAIGLTGSILGGVFNTLAISMTEGMNIVLRIVCMLIILLLGHAINFGLCTISSLVHPLRLIFVEYYKNAEFEGGGKAYNPFRKV